MWGSWLAGCRLAGSWPGWPWSGQGTGWLNGPGLAARVGPGCHTQPADNRGPYLLGTAACPTSGHNILSKLKGKETLTWVSWGGVLGLLKILPLMILLGILLRILWRKTLMLLFSKVLLLLLILLGQVLLLRKILLMLRKILLLLMKILHWLLRYCCC